MYFLTSIGHINALKFSFRFQISALIDSNSWVRQKFMVTGERDIYHQVTHEKAFYFHQKVFFNAEIVFRC